MALKIAKYRQDVSVAFAAGAAMVAATLMNFRRQQQNPAAAPTARPSPIDLVTALLDS
jgi:hypothetical protein